MQKSCIINVKEEYHRELLPALLSVTRYHIVIIKTVYDQTFNIYAETSDQIDYTDYYINGLQVKPIDNTRNFRVMLRCLTDTARYISSTSFSHFYKSEGSYAVKA